MTHSSYCWSSSSCCCCCAWSHAYYRVRSGHIHSKFFYGFYTFPLSPYYYASYSNHYYRALSYFGNAYCGAP